MKSTLILLLFFQVEINLGIVCPPDYVDGGDGTCHTGIFSARDRNHAYDICASSGGYLYDAANRFANSWIQNQAEGNSNFIWMGLTCTSSQKSSCIWDNGQPLAFDNFNANSMNISSGPCVVMQVSSGMWYSTDCSNTNAVFGCKYSPQYTMRSCSQNPPSKNQTSDGFVTTFRGNCYYAIIVESNIDEANACSQNCGKPTSIHSDGENMFSVGLALSYRSRLNQSISNFILTGLGYQNGKYSWADGSTVDYNAFGLNNPSLGSCVSLAIADDIVPTGNWSSSPCFSPNLNFGICQKPLNNSCDGYITPIPTQSPTQCQSTAYSKSGSGQIYSPGYPLGSEVNQCEYVITEDQGALATITFERLQLDQFSSIQLFDSFGLTPFASISNTNVTGRKYQSGTNLLRIVYYTPGSKNYLNLWKADYNSKAIPSSQTVSCTFIIDWLYEGLSAIPTANASYLQQRDFVSSVASQLFANTKINFSANFGFYGAISANQCSCLLVQSDYIQQFSKFETYLKSYSPSDNCIMDLCDATFLIDLFISSQNPFETCLVFFSGESTSQFNYCVYRTFNNYDYVIGAGLKASDGLTLITPNIVQISSDFTPQDATSLVDAILNTVGQPIVTTPSTTAIPPAPISCSFILDWDYLGFNITEYIKQRDFVDTVANQLYGSSSVIFGGNTGFYGNIDSNDCFFSIINSDYYIDAASFDSYLTSKTPSTDCPLDLCDALDSLNDFTPGSTPQLSCLVFLSGGSDDFTACGYPIDKTKYNVVIGAALNANTKVSEISDYLVNISSNFDQNDVKTLVNQIISVAQQKS